MGRVGAALSLWATLPFDYPPGDSRLIGAGFPEMTEGMRFLGIDYGERRIGLSYGDQLGVATPLPAITAAEEGKRREALAGVIRDRRITELVIGHPLNMDDSVGPKAKAIEAVAVRLRGEFGLPVHLVDERLTSYEAEATIAKSKRRSIRASGIIDSRAATLILQDYLDQRFPPPSPELSVE